MSETNDLYVLCDNCGGRVEHPEFESGPPILCDSCIREAEDESR